MTDTYLQPEVHIVITQSPGVDGISSPAQLAQIEADLAALEAMPVISNIADLADVDDAAPANGNLLVWDAAEEMWKLGTVTAGIRVRNTSGASVSLSANDLTFYNGMTALHSEASGRTYAYPVIGNTAGTLAAGNHAHTEITMFRVDIAPTGYLSSGTRLLISTTALLLDGISYLVEATLKIQTRGGDEGPCYFQTSVGIAEAERISPSGASGKWSVQGVPQHIEWSHNRTRPGYGTPISITASVSYDSGGGTYFDHGELEIRLTPNR